MSTHADPLDATTSDKLRSRSGLVSAELRDEILRGRYRAGDRLPSERDLADRFSVHRGTVREALKQLEQLGLAEIRPGGGARVQPLESASLDVVAHLLELDDPPEPRLVDQLLEALSGLFALAARLGAERADETQRDRVKTLLLRLEDTALDLDERHDTMHQLGDAFVEASGNLVLQLVRHGLKSRQIFDRLHEHNTFLARDRSPAIGAVWLPHLREALDARDGAAAANAVHQMTLEFRRFARETLEARLRNESDAAHVNGVR
ncbi:MAG: GntR family transcriptional regulator [Myxococcota bacterium]